MIPTLNWNLWTRKQIALTVVILALAAGAAYSFSVARAKPVTNTVLSDPWQCAKTAGILTVCTKRSG